MLSFANDDGENYSLYTDDEIRVFREFYIELKDAVLKRDKYKVSKMNNYPLFVITETGEKIIRDKKEFIDNFEDIINSRILDIVKKTDFEELSLMYSGYKVGEGEILIDVGPGSKFAVVVFAYDNTEIQTYDEILKEKQKEIMALKGKWRKVLVDQISDADRIDILGTYPDHNKLLFSIIGKDKIKEFINIIEIDEEESGEMCMCLGDVYFIFKNRNLELAKVSYHHGCRLRWLNGKWLNDGVLTKNSEEKLKIWFKDQGYPDFLLDNPIN